MTAPYSIRPAGLDDVGFLTEVSIEATRAQGRLPADFDEVEWRAGFAEWSTQVLQEAAAAGIPLDLGVEKDNLNARRLYDRLGFTKIGEDDREDKLRWQP